MNKYCFRPQQGLTIMNAYGFDVAMLEVEFPSPTGATYYESEDVEVARSFFTNVFPSPTGATYYEFVYCDHYYTTPLTGFRPQQGLPIMNTI